MTAEEHRLTRLDLLRQTSMEQYGFGPKIMRGIRVCPDCGMPSAAEEKICRTCGGKLPAETLYQQYKKRHRFCRRCDLVVSAGALYCPQCGERTQTNGRSIADAVRSCLLAVSPKEERL